MNNIEDVIMKVMTEPDFAEALLASPGAVLQAEGIEATPEILQVLADLKVEELRVMAEKFSNQGIAM
ncbi:MAG: hypothetical protein IPO91_12325 [Chloroflexi bacterium]|nr:hypothetical protein [Chloroflexota bacterium]